MSEPLQILEELGVPAWLVGIMGLLVVATLFAKQVESLQPFLTIIGRVVAGARNPEKRRIVRLRKRFADHLDSQIRLMNNQEEWSDARFAELEAEVEFEGVTRSRLLRGFRRGRGIRRARSLSRALEVSGERLIILQGDPGSGKSVALRHLALRLAKRAATSASPRSVLPVYVNMRDWKPARIPDAQAVHDLAVEYLNKANVRDVAVFVQKNFEQGLNDGSWIFLFDSFDEIPEILSSSEVDTSVRQYRQALYQFLNSPGNRCRGIVASREFRGPSTYGLATFRITPLSMKRRYQLVKRAELEYNVRESLLSALPKAEETIQKLTDNPMFLGLLCEDMRDGGAFPTNSYSVFESYVSRRLERDAPAVKRKYGSSAPQMRETAENMAFTIGIEPSLGLSPTVDALQQAMLARGMTTENLIDGISALAYTKLARIDPNEQGSALGKVAFAHRRFQEYFATCVVLRDLQLVPPRVLLRDARWREAAVTIFQTQPATSLRPLIDSATRILDYHLRTITRHESGSGEPGKLWPTGLLHLLRILDAGIVRHSEPVVKLEKRVDRIIDTVFTRGTLPEKKWAVDVAGAASDDCRLQLFRRAFADHSQWLKTSVYRQLGREGHLPKDVARAVRVTLIGMQPSGDLRRERLGVNVQLRRLAEPRDFLQCMRLLLTIPVVDLFLVAIPALAVVDEAARHGGIVFVAAYLLVIALPAVLGAHVAVHLLPGAWPSSWSGPPGSGRVMALMRRWLLYATLRILPLLWVLLFSWGLPEGSPNVAPLFVLIAYAATWAPGAYFVCREGTLLSPLYWPLYPLVFFYYACKGAVHHLSRIVHDLQHYVRVIARRLPEIALYLLLGGFSAWLAHLAGGQTWGWMFPALTAGAIGVMLIGGWALRLAKWVVDWLRVWRWAPRGAPISVTELITSLERLSTDRAREKYIFAVRRQRALLPHQTTIDELNVSLSGVNAVSSVSEGREGGERYPATAASRVVRGKRAPLGVKVRDEIAQLVEELTSAQDGIESPANGPVRT